MSLDFRLTRVLRAKKEKENLNPHRMAEEIRLAVGRIEGHVPEEAPLDRRKLDKILKGRTNFSLTVDELRALDVYLAPDGEGLAQKPLFERAGLLDALATDNVRCYLGARPRKNRHDISFWDVLTLSWLQNEVLKITPYARVHFKPVVPGTEMSELRRELDTLPPMCAVLAIGSPRACRVTEAMLRAMVFGSRRRPPQGLEAPFAFFWPREDGLVESWFAAQRSDVRASAEVRLQPKDWAIVYQTEPEAREATFTAGISRRTGETDYRTPDYGIIVAQRRRKDIVWVVVAGLSGPGTFAAAKALVQLQSSPQGEALGEPRIDDDGPTLFAVVEADITLSGGPGDRRNVGQDVNFVVEPTLLDRT